MPNNQSSPAIESQLEIIDIATKKRDIIYTKKAVFEAPNWHPTDDYLIFNENGKLYKLPTIGGEPAHINTDFAIRCNNDHGISADGKQIVISHHLENNGDSAIYVLPIEGGEPRRVTKLTPSYWHGWSPDGKTLAYVGGRPNSDGFNIYSIDIEGGKETQLTSAQGLDDGPDYSPDGRSIYFNSYQTGMMQIWKMDADGKNPVQMVESPHSDWFAHPSPNGKHIVFIRYIEDQIEKHPFGCDVKLMLLNLESGALSDLTEVFYGGQGSINVPNWSPDSKRLAFVSYKKC